MDFKKWLRQPSTIDGIGYVVGVAAASVAQVLTHQNLMSVAIGTVAKAFVHLAINDASAEAPADNSIEKLVTDTVTAIAQKKVAAAMPALTADVLTTLGTLHVVPAQAAPALALASALAPALETAMAAAATPAPAPAAHA